jgi:hypothetical protein
VRLPARRHTPWKWSRTPQTPLLSPLTRSTPAGTVTAAIPTVTAQTFANRTSPPNTHRNQTSTATITPLPLITLI